MKIVLFLALLLCAAAPAWAKPLVADLSQYRIELDSGFNGTRLLLFGARNDIGDIVVVVRGPEKQFTVRKKERVAGIWINRKEERFDNIPAYYAIASSKPFEAMHDETQFASLRIGLEEAVKAGAHGDDMHFSDALIRHQQVLQLYSQAPQKVSFMGESLFKLVIPFPDNIPRGDYSADVYLFNDGQLQSMQSIPLHVERTGFDAFVYDFAHTHGMLYGLLAVAIALTIGWGASALMQRV